MDERSRFDEAWFRRQVAGTVVSLGTILVLFALIRAIPAPRLQRTLNRWLTIGTNPVRL